MSDQPTGFPGVECFEEETREPGLPDQTTPRYQAARFLHEECGVPLDHPTGPPYVQFKDGQVEITIVTQSPNSPEYQAAKAALESRGCKITLDHGSMQNFTVLRIIAPPDLFPLDTIKGLTAESVKEATRIESSKDVEVYGGC